MSRPGPLRLWHDEMTARFEAGTFARIRAVLEPAEDRTAFVREAVAAELAKREDERRRAIALENVAGWIV